MEPSLLGPYIPVLFAKISILPKVAIACSTALSTTSSWEASPTITIAYQPNCFDSSAISSKGPRVPATRTKLAPA